MKNPITLLCVEDRDNYLVDLQAMLATELPRLPFEVKVLYARDLATAAELFSQSDAVLTDVFFPAIPGGDEEGNGQIIVARCLAEGKPVEWVTSTFRHGTKTNPLNEWGRHCGMEMFDSEKMGYSVRRDEEAPQKPWKKAFYSLLCLMIDVEKGKFTFQDGKIMERDEKGEWEPHYGHRGGGRESHFFDHFKQ